MASISKDPNENMFNKSSGNANKIWKQMLAELGPLCASLLDTEALQNIAGGHSPIAYHHADLNNGATASNGDANKNHHNTVSIVHKLREIVASIDCHLLNFKPIEPESMWATTFCKPIHEQRNLFETSIFGFRNAGHCIPLHDHPKMYGFIQPLHGRVSVHSYSWLEPYEENRLLLAQKCDTTKNAINRETLRPARYAGQLILSSTLAESSCCPATSQVALLDPTIANVHMIKAIDDGAAFFDLLVPGYHSENRTCTYYTILGNDLTAMNQQTHQQEPAIGDIVWLEGSEDSPDYFTMQRIR